MSGAAGTEGKVRKTVAHVSRSSSSPGMFLYQCVVSKSHRIPPLLLL